MKALATDAHERSVVAGIRGLGRAGIPVIAVAPGRTAAGLWSRYADVRRRMSPLPDQARAVLRTAAHYAPLVLYPGTEESIDDVLTAPSIPRGVLLPYPRLEALDVLRDKRSLAQLARDGGLATPVTLAEGTASELGRASIPVPCVLKPVRSGGALATTRVARSGPELRAVLRSLPPGEPLLVQELYRGSLAAVSLVLDGGGRVLARFQQAARGIWPPEVGVSSVAASVAPDEDLISKAAGVLRAAGYGGLAQLQFLVGPRGPLLVDVNPRFYGSLPLALASGVNLPAIWHASVTDGAPSSPPSYRVGVTYRWFHADLAAAVRGDPAKLLRRAPRPRVGAVWAADDPAPAVMSTVGTLAGALARRLGAPSAR